jgi:succinoglycan biosynthesis protein ExoU
VRQLLEAVMPAYNAASTLAESVASAWDHNRVPVVLIDDGSTDGTADVASTRAGVRVIRQANAGPSVARNRGILESQAEFVLFLDSDDLLLPGYREQFERALEAQPEGDVFVCGMQVRDTSDALVSVHAAPDLLPSPFLCVLRGCPVPTNGIIVRRSALARAGLFRPGLHYAEDLDLWLRLAAATDRWVAMDDPLALYRLRADSLSKNAPGMWRAIHTVVREAARTPGAPRSARRAAAQLARSRAARYVFINGYAARLQRSAHTSPGALAGELCRLPGRLWPLALRQALGFAWSRLSGPAAPK